MKAPFRIKLSLTGLKKHPVVPIKGRRIVVTQLLRFGEVSLPPGQDLTHTTGWMGPGSHEDEDGQLDSYLTFVQGIDSKGMNGSTLFIRDVSFNEMKNLSAVAFRTCLEATLNYNQLVEIPANTPAPGQVLGRFPD